MPKVIVSMASFPAAVPLAVRAAESVLNGAVKPDKVVVYLTAPQSPARKFPRELRGLEHKYPLLEVRFCDRDIRSYAKLVPALKDFPDDVIVTVDGGVLYNKNMLRGLLRLHGRYPDAVIAHDVRRLKYGVPYKDLLNDLLHLSDRYPADVIDHCDKHLILDAPYREWRRYKWYSAFTGNSRPRFGNVPAGAGGVLYPPNSLKAEMLDPAIFMDMAPTAEGIWFWAAAVANGTKTAPIPFGHSKPRVLKKPCRKNVNVKFYEDANRAALKMILDEYPVIWQKVEYDK